jgi:hypothetical protein
MQALLVEVVYAEVVAPSQLDTSVEMAVCPETLAKLKGLWNFVTDTEVVEQRLGSVHGGHTYRCSTLNTRRKR